MDLKLVESDSKIEYSCITTKFSSEQWSSKLSKYEILTAVLVC